MSALINVHEFYENCKVEIQYVIKKELSDHGPIEKPPIPYHAC